MNVLNSDQNNNENNVYVVPGLFSKELEEILQKIFLFLDPKSLKNSKLTCSRWREFIERRIWRSPSARKVLQRRLYSNWKNEDQVEVSKIRLDFYPNIVVCDNAVMVFADDETGRYRVFSSSTYELLYGITLDQLAEVSIGQDFIGLRSSDCFVTIIDKFSGKIEFKFSGKIEFKEMNFKWWSLKMIGNTVFAIANKPHADLLILSMNPKTFEWTKEEQKTGIHNDDESPFFTISGDQNYILIASNDRIHLWDWRNGMHSGQSVQCRNVAMIEFSNPYTFAAVESIDGIHHSEYVRIFNIFTEEVIRNIYFESSYVFSLEMEVGQRFCCVAAPGRAGEEIKCRIFDIEEVTRETTENDQLWQRNVGVGYPVAIMTSKMVIVRDRTVKIYDFWPDKDDEVTDIGAILDLFLKNL